MICVLNILRADKFCEMKNILLIYFCLFSVYVNSQNVNDDQYEKGSVSRLDHMGKAYISEIKKVANITYNSDDNIIINIRKEKSFSNSSVSKDIYFTGSNAQGPCEGFIDESEIDDALTALQYINDSLLATAPENETHFAKRFSNSYFVIYASFDPGSGKLFSKAEWDINIILNEHEPANNQGSIHIKKNDLWAFIKMIEACKDKLKAF